MMAAETLPAGYGFFSHPFGIEMFGSTFGHSVFEVSFGLMVLPFALGLLAKRQPLITIVAFLALCVVLSVFHAKFVLAEFGQASMPFPLAFFVQWSLLSIPAAAAGYFASVLLDRRKVTQ